MSADDLLGPRRQVIREIAARHGVVSIRVFGSFARGDVRPDSDIDLLIERGARRTPFFPGGLVADLEELLGRRVDVVTEAALPAGIRDRVLKEAVAL